jgi:hypothetical protein
MRRRPRNLTLLRRPRRRDRNSSVKSWPEVNAKNKQEFPPKGKAYVEGKAVCGMRDLNDWVEHRVYVDAEPAR